jgi:hypothetical protein
LPRIVTLPYIDEYYDKCIEKVAKNRYFTLIDEYLDKCIEKVANHRYFTSIDRFLGRCLEKTANRGLHFGHAKTKHAMDYGGLHY